MILKKRVLTRTPEIGDILTADLLLPRPSTLNPRPLFQGISIDSNGPIALQNSFFDRNPAKNPTQEYWLGAPTSATFLLRRVKVHILFRDNEG
jgi:hypothetical protein